MGRVSAVAKPTVTHVRGHEIVPEAVLRRRKTLAEVGAGCCRCFATAGVLACQRAELTTRAAGEREA